MEHYVHQILEHGDMSSHHVDDHLASTGIKGLFGGKTFFGGDGQLIGHTEPNAFGGKNVFSGLDPNPIAQTVATPDGHANLAHPGEDGLHILKIGNATSATHDGSPVYVAHDLGHGFHSVMTFSDPLLHLSEYSVPSLKF